MLSFGPVMFLLRGYTIQSQSTAGKVLVTFYRPHFWLAYKCGWYFDYLGIYWGRNMSHEEYRTNYEVVNSYK